jgi:hypothetical protein
VVRLGVLLEQLVGICPQSSGREGVIVGPEFAGLLPDQQNFSEAISAEKLVAIIGSYIVETPASIADDRVNATDGDQLMTQLNV